MNIAKFRTPLSTDRLCVLSTDDRVVLQIAHNRIVSVIQNDMRSLCSNASKRRLLPLHSGLLSLVRLGKVEQHTDEPHVPKESRQGSWYIWPDDEIVMVQ